MTVLAEVLLLSSALAIVFFCAGMFLGWRMAERKRKLEARLSGGELVVTLSADTTQFTNEMQAVHAALDRLAKRMPAVGASVH